VCFLQGTEAPYSELYRRKKRNFSGPEIQGVDKERGLGRIEKCSPAAQTN